MEMAQPVNCPNCGASLNEGQPCAKCLPQLELEQPDDEATTPANDQSPETFASEPSSGALVQGSSTSSQWIFAGAGLRPRYGER